MTTFDAVSLEILWKRLISIVDEASATLVRTSFSSVVRESHDFACVITTPDGSLLAQGTQSIPSFIGTLPRTVRYVVDEIGEDNLGPDDILITNDPWMGTGHLPDINIVKPIFHDGRIVAFAAAVSHMVDIGGRGSSIEMRDIYEEGVQIPPMKLVDAGEPSATLVAILSKNVRSPGAVIGDLWAQVASVNMIERRLLALLAECGLDDLTDLSSEIFDRSERAMREAIRSVPAGSYTFTLRPDGLPMEVDLVIRLDFDGETCLISMEGTSPEVAGLSINSVFAYSAAYATYGLKCVLAPHLDNNQGSLRPIRVEIPEGSILNHRHPISGMMRHLVSHHLSSGVISALAQLMPERAMAQSGTPIWYLHQTGQDAEGLPYVNMFFFNGGTGAMQGRDGASALSWPSNISGTPVEQIERMGPFRILSKSLRDGSGGAGAYRGGLGQKIEFEITETSPITVAFAVDHLTRPAEGLAGGSDGATGALEINGVPADPHRTHTLRTGDVIAIMTPGGGGYGHPKDRPAHLSERDQLQGYTA